MEIKNIYRLFYIVLGMTGILIEFGVIGGNLKLWVINYYTVLSNILCVAYFSMRLILDNRKGESTRFQEFITSPLTKYSVTMCITLTFLVYHFLLNPVWASSQEWSAATIGNYIVHYIIPVMTIIDFLIFDRQKISLRWYAPFIWMIIPVTYFVFILLRAPLLGNIGPTASPYPYPFIDFTIQPVEAVMYNIGGIIVAFIVIGYVLLGVDRVVMKVMD